jgi:hypothetical protein
MQKVVLDLRYLCLKHAHGSSEGLIFVNPNDPSKFMQIGHTCHKAWATAIHKSEPGVVYTHPPIGPNYQWEDIPEKQFWSVDGTSATEAITIEDFSSPSGLHPLLSSLVSHSNKNQSDFSVVATPNVRQN